MNITIVLGNGFSMDFINYIKKSSEVDLKNLFYHGSEVVWPVDNTKGFLSFRNCPYLWNLGARQGIEYDSSMKIIEDIITCANVFALGKSSRAKVADQNDKNLYIFAYKELIEYLKHLFIYYNSTVSDDFLGTCEITKWKWAEYFLKIFSDSSINEVNIITYNYDIWLERVLKLINIPFRVLPFESSLAATKFNIYKPHGSISFCHKIKNDNSSYSIKYNYDLSDGKTDDFEIKYINLDDYFILTALIPPAGESTRYNQSWANEIKSEILKKIEIIDIKDSLLICGISYWYVDRNEIDEILTNTNKDIILKVINPYMNGTFNAVLTSLFKNFTLHRSI